MIPRSASTPAFLLRTLGSAELCELGADGQPRLRLLGPGKPLALLAYCCSARDREHSRDFLASLLWSDTDAARSRQSVRQALWRLRRLVGESVRTRDDAVLGVDARIDCDRDVFLAAVHRGDALAAVKAYGGPFLAGLTVPGGDEFEDWAALERRHLAESLLRVVEPYARGLVREGRPAQAREILAKLATLKPDSLDARRVIVDVLIDLGDSVGARRHADVLESLAQGLGGSAPRSVETLIARARNSGAPVAGDRPVAVVLDLVGREDAFGEALNAWKRARQGETQVVVLSGVAGIGKSRLLTAIEQRCAAGRALTATVRANPGERDVPFGFAATIARALAALPGAAGISAESARELVALDPGLGSQFVTTPSLEDGGEAVRRRALALLDLLSAIVEQEPLALMLDDLHWADVASRQLLSIVLGRAVDLSLLVVATTRGTSTTIYDQRKATALPLLPLDADDVIDAVRSSGRWPDSPDCVRFVEMLASVTEGIPLSAMERLTLVRERGLLTLADGQWTSPDWAAATTEVAVASPLDHRLSACSDMERAVLLALAVAGTPLVRTVLMQTTGLLVPARRVTPSHRARTIDVSPGQAALATLEVKGLVVRVGESWVPNHDVITERSLARATPDERDACHLALAQSLASSGDPHNVPRAVRHFLLGGDAGQAGTQLARVVERARALGDRRPVRDLLSEIVAEQLPAVRLKRVMARVPWWHRTTLTGGRVIIGMLGASAIAIAVWAVSLLLQPVLMVTQAPSFSIRVAAKNEPADMALGPDVRRTQPSVLISVPDGLKLRPTVIHMRALTPGTRILDGDSSPVIKNLAAFNRMRFSSTSAVSTFRFEARGFRPVDITVRGEELGATGTRVEALVRPVGGTLLGAKIDPRAPSIRVAPGEVIEGHMEVEYTTPWYAASVWLSMTPTWGDPRVQGHEVTPILAAVSRELLSAPVKLIAPSRPGHYWILYTIAAEPSGLFALSGTNWTVERPIWGDGNDLASLSDSSIRQANIAGYLMTQLALPIDWPAAGRQCVPVDARISSIRIKHCPIRIAMFGIEVNVR